MSSPLAPLEPTRKKNPTTSPMLPSSEVPFPNFSGSSRVSDFQWPCRPDPQLESHHPSRWSRWNKTKAALDCISLTHGLIRSTGNMHTSFASPSREEELAPNTVLHHSALPTAPSACDTFVFMPQSVLEEKGPDFTSHLCVTASK
ncbi:uncharacterized protein LOC144578720 [Callithrix jacchus]